MKGEVKTINGKRIATTEYGSWQAMKNRCLNPRAQDWSYYGGRGIRICKRWYVYDEFIKDMGRKPAREYTLERKNSNGHYSKRNCVWATRKTQGQNRPYCTLNQAKADKIRRLYARGGVFQYELAERFGVTQALISQITLGRVWA